MYHEWKDRDALRKRDQKAVFKTQQMNLSKEQLQASRQSMGTTIENEYIKACTKNLIEVKQFVNNIREAWGEEWYCAAVKKMETLDTYFKNISTLKTPTAKKENPRITLKEFCEGNACALDPLDCVREINNVNHGCILRGAWRLLIRD